MTLFIFQICIFWFMTMEQNTIQPSYEVQKINRPIHLTGSATDILWEKAIPISNFVYPWNDGTPPKTIFRGLWDQQFFYFCFVVDDMNIIAPGDPDDKRGVLPSDRVEIFFKSQGAMDPYFCLEMDPIGRVLDYKAHYYRNVDFDWKWPDQGLEVFASLIEKGYVVEGKISLQSMRELGILNATTIHAGLFRGDFYPVDGKENKVKWISWIKPDSENPDFHIPSAFGIFQLIERP